MKHEFSHATPPKLFDVLIMVNFHLQLCYKEKYYNSRGTLLPMPITPQLMHCFHVNELNSNVGVTHTCSQIYCGILEDMHA